MTMEHLLDYAPALSPVAGMRRWQTGAATVVLATAGAALAVYGSADGAIDYLATFGGCATGRGEAQFQLQVLTPLSFTLPASGWWLANRVGFGVLLCRSALWAGIAAWLTACACAFT